ncbi:MAG TPA: TonB-dependent receptor [Candidatus Acidoferrales bacterium]|nr:TonB-dependent receptor [Candidatus Acidoferrales bacterium]
MENSKRAAAIGLLVALCAFAAAPPAWTQTSATGQIVGTVQDPSKAVVPNATVTVSNAATGLERTATTSSMGSYAISLLPPGSYTVTVTAAGFKTQSMANVAVAVASTAALNVTLQIGATSQTVTVQESGEMLQTQDAANGTTVNERTVPALPLTNRNYTQILALSPGVVGQVPNAATLGKNSVDVNVNGGRIMDNSYQMDGQDASNLQTQGTAGVVSVGGISIPNPDSIQEFKVQTSLYDAAYGRGSGANVDVVTKAGTDQFHGDLFEFARNDVFNANDFFLNRNGQHRPVLKQHQFGGTLGGPVVKDRLFFFGSYQGTLQTNGEGSSSLASVVLPPLTSDRSAATLGTEFCGQKGKFGGVGVACDGSNINPVALKLLNTKLSSGQFFIPTPQVIESNGSGFSVFSIPSTFREDQFLVNTDYVLAKHRIAERFFWSRAPELQSFTSSNVPGSGINALFLNINSSIKDTYLVSPSVVNEASIGYHRTYGRIDSLTPVKSADIGISPSCNNPIMPIITVQGSFELGGNFNDGQYTVSQTYAAQDQISWIKGRNDIRAGVGFERVALPFADPAVNRGDMTFLSFPDFLLGMSAAQNGSPFSNLFTSDGLCGDTQRHFRVNDWTSFFQDDLRVSSHLTLNLGVRYDVYGQSSDTTGHLVDFWPQLANNDFSSGGTLTGLIAASNFPGTLPAGVARNSNETFAGNPYAWGAVQPRFGFAWQPGFNNRLVLRGGYGLYYSRTSINDAFQLITSPPFFLRQTNSGVLNAAATFQVPFNPGPPAFSAFPVWVQRTANTQLSLASINPDWTPPLSNQWGLSVEYGFTPSTMLQVGYVGTNGQRIELTRSINEAFLASPSNPVNGVTTNTLANARQRVTFLGYSPGGLGQAAEIGSSMYHSLQTSLLKRMSRGLQFQVAYTYGKAMTDATGFGTFPSGGGLQNDVRHPGENWGPADFDRRQRFVANYLWNLPSYRKAAGFAGKMLSGWGASGVITVQTGPTLTFTDNRSGTIFGFSGQRAQLCSGATYGSIPTSGSVQSRLSNFFNASAFCPPAAIGNGFAYGTTGRGITVGPGQHNLDMAIFKTTKIPGFTEASSLEFRAEFYNTFNTPQFSSTTTTQFSTPMTVVGSANFGQITSTSVSPRLIQFGLKYIF